MSKRSKESEKTSTKHRKLTSYFRPQSMHGDPASAAAFNAPASSTASSAPASSTAPSAPASSTVSSVPVSATVSSDLSLAELKQYVPSKNFIFPKTLSLNQTRSCQRQYFDIFKWLHYDIKSDNVRCFMCMHTYEQNLFIPGRKLQKTFIFDGFSTWKKCPKALKEHELSDQHKEASEKLMRQNISKTDVAGMVTEQHKRKQQQHQRALKAMFESAMYLLEQGLPFQGHDDESGNFIRLLHLRARDVPALEAWLTRRDKWCSHSIQNEIIESIGNSVRENICSEIRAAGVFSIIADGTQDIAGLEQLSIVFRYVSQTLEIKEDFVGFYNLPGETGLTISKAIEDAVIRLQLDMKSNRGLGFDGASNMSGRFKGARAIIKDRYPLSVYFHCANHSLDLSLQEVAREEDVIHTTLEFARNCANFVRNSGKRRAQFKTIASDLENVIDGTKDCYSTVQALCPTRWVVRTRGLTSIARNWKPLKCLFDDIVSDKDVNKEVRAKAAGMSKKLNSFSMFFGIRLAILIFAPCENLARQLQAKTSTACSALNGSQVLTRFLQDLRSDAAFNKLFDESVMEATQLHIPDPPSPRKKKIPVRYENESVEEGHSFPTFKDKARKEFFSVIDRLITSISDRFNQAGITFAAKLERLIVDAANGKIELIDEVNCYPEISGEDLKNELNLFQSVIRQGHSDRENPVKTIQEILNAFKNVPPSTREIVPNIHRLLRLLLTLPATTASAERTFSGLRRLKTYLRSTMTQQRLSAVAICNYHKDRISTIPVIDLCKKFVVNSSGPERRFTFGHF